MLHMVWINGVQTVQVRNGKQNRLPAVHEDRRGRKTRREREEKEKKVKKQEGEEEGGRGVSIDTKHVGLNSEKHRMVYKYR